MAVLLNGIISRNKNCVFFRGLNFPNELVLLKSVQTVTLAITPVLTKTQTILEVNYKGKRNHRGTSDCLLLVLADIRAASQP